MSPCASSPDHGRLLGALDRLVPGDAEHLARWLAATRAPVGATLNLSTGRVCLQTARSWVEVGPGGRAGGWSAPEGQAIETAVLAAPDHDLRPHLLGWAVENAIERVAAVRAPADGGWRELRVPLPRWPADRTLASVGDVFERLATRWLGDQVSLALTVGSFGAPALLVAWSEASMRHIGLSFVEPPIDLGLRLARALLVEDDPRADLLEEAFGAEPTELSCIRHGSDVELALTWPPSAASSTAGA